MESRPVLLIRGLGNDRDAQALANHGIATVSESFTEITAGKSEEALRLLELAQDGEAWVIVTSRNGIEFWNSLVQPRSLETIFQNNSALKFAATALGSSQALTSLGVTTVLTSPERNSHGLLNLLSSYPPSRAILPLGNLARRTLPDGLTGLGWSVHTGLVYNNSPVATTPAAMQGIPRGDFSALLLRSPSAAHALAHFLPNPTIRLICGDASTAQAARDLALNVTAVSDDPSPEMVAELVAQTLEE